MLNIFRRGDASAHSPHAMSAVDRSEAIARVEPTMTRAHASVGLSAAGVTFDGLNDPRLLDYIREGQSGGGMWGRSCSLRNMAVLRCVTLISEAIGTLPLNLIGSDDRKQVQRDHPAHRLLKYKPNDWQTPYEFKSLLQLHTLLDGQGFARVIWSRDRPVRLVPMPRGSTKPRQTDTWEMKYDFTSASGESITLGARDVFHLRDLSLDGVNGLSRVTLASEVLELASAAQRAASRTFRTGVMAGGALKFKEGLSEQTYARMREQLDAFGGPESAGRWLIAEEGAEPVKFANTASDAQQVENRNHQIEEVARMYGVPRPLLMMDDTSWGSGIEQLAIFFVQYALSHWFTAWEQAAARVLLPEEALDEMQFKFNEGALLRGTLNDQANFFAKALGAGGHAPWMSQNEVRDLSNLPKSRDAQADLLRNPMTQKRKGRGDESTQPA
ncbi:MULTISPECIES: phage portal protein [unclassified Caballeronia]|uniref:phage portal protein n=1 Tax=unclassified Caballeronia TaxID=2646786 RepID=UPI0028668D40|nr:MULTISPECIES: phage portal protein [unclassified Caballeronia]MDR5776550.1 phage portal protein [Caballeronia sp. LZ002]MDR5851986.1 phage portal protein [Caballeronia sp. LZ003]